jgi:CRP/FNR family transcriptional regulator, cyclic AMP receptor protein
MGGDEPTDVEAEFLARIPIFGGLPEGVVQRIANAARTVRLAAGAQVIEEGERALNMFVVRQGELEICKRGRDGAEFCLAVLKSGDCVGEMSLIDIQPRSATVRALGPAMLYVLDQTEIARLYKADLEAYTLLVLNIAREISRRLRCADQVLVDMGMAVQGVWTAPSPLPER